MPRPKSAIALRASTRGSGQMRENGPSDETMERRVLKAEKFPRSQRPWLVMLPTVGQWERTSLESVRPPVPVVFSAPQKKSHDVALAAVAPTVVALGLRGANRP